MNASFWLTNLAAYGLQIALLAAAGALLPLCCRLRLPKARLAYWQILLAACLALPAIQPWKRPAAAPSKVSIETAVVATRADQPAFRLPPPAEIALAALFAGILARAAWLALGFRRLGRYRRHATLLIPPPPSVERAQFRIGVGAPVYLSTEVSGPVTFGFFRPAILFPSLFLEMDPGLQEGIACHELLHVRRRDWLFTVFEECIRAALWFHPAVWWLLGQIQLAREQVVDREVVALTRNRDQYLRALLDVAGGKAGLDLAPAPLFLRKRHLTQRVASIVKEISMSKRQLISSLSFTFVLLVVAGCFAVWAFPLRAPAQEEGPVTVTSGNANLLHRTPIEYPREAREKGVQGDVVLEVSLNEKGVVSDARVLSGPEELRRTALQSVLQWHYSKDAMSLPAKIQVTLNFKLPDPSSGANAALQGRVLVLPSGRQVGLVSGSAPADKAPNMNLGVLKEIQVNGLPPAARDTLMQKLQVQVGDSLTRESIDRIRQVVQESDEHLLLGFRQLPNGEGAILNISLRGQGPVTPPIAIAQSKAAAQQVAPDVSTGPMRIRVGGAVQAQNLVQQVRPAYPPLAKQARIQGSVILNAVIGKDGAVQNISVVSGHPLLLPAALEAVKNWVYKPTLLNGDPVEVITEINVNFTLTE